MLRTLSMRRIRATAATAFSELGEPKYGTQGKDIASLVRAHEYAQGHDDQNRDHKPAENPGP
jgi:hypothetical protein